MAGYPRLDFAVLRADGSPAPGYERDEIVERFDVRDRLAPSRELARVFAAAIAGTEKPSPDGEDGLRAIEAIEACYRSSRSGEAVRLPLQ